VLYDRKGLRIFVYHEPIDMRYGFERLHSFCIHGLRAKMDQGHFYLFFGKNRRRLKVLWYDGTGLMLATKRMEKGSFMRLEDLLGRQEISHKELGADSSWQRDKKPCFRAGRGWVRKKFIDAKGANRLAVRFKSK
jgi:hypothetical protein